MYFTPRHTESIFHDNNSTPVNVSTPARYSAEIWHDIGVGGWFSGTWSYVIGYEHDTGSVPEALQCLICAGRRNSVQIKTFITGRAAQDFFHYGSRAGGIARVCERALFPSHSYISAHPSPPILPRSKCFHIMFLTVYMTDNMHVCAHLHVRPANTTNPRFFLPVDVKMPLLARLRVIYI